MHHILHYIVINESSTVVFEIKMPAVTGYTRRPVRSLGMPTSGADGFRYGG